MSKSRAFTWIVQVTWVGDRFEEGDLLEDNVSDLLTSSEETTHFPVNLIGWVRKEWKLFQTDIAKMKARSHDLVVKLISIPVKGWRGELTLDGMIVLYCLFKAVSTTLRFDTFA
jgi:hypothetical protein